MLLALPFLKFCWMPSVLKIYVTVESEKTENIFSSSCIITRNTHILLGKKNHPPSIYVFFALSIKLWCHSFCVHKSTLSIYTKKLWCTTKLFTACFLVFKSVFVLLTLSSPLFCFYILNMHPTWIVKIIASFSWAEIFFLITTFYVKLNGLKATK